MNNISRILLKKLGIYLIIIMTFTIFHYSSLCANASQSGNTVILTQPKDQQGLWGSTVQFRVKASGNNLKYQWQYKYDGDEWRNTVMTGNNTDTLTVDVNYDRARRKYRCIVTGDAGTVISAAAGLTCVKATEVTEQPKDQQGLWGSTVQFRVKASGSNLKYQWQYKYDGDEWRNTAMSGYNTDTLSVDVCADRAQRKYRCIVTGDAGTVISAVAGLTGMKPTEVTEQPKDQQGLWGSIVQFHVGASGSNLRYQWQCSYDGEDWFNTNLTGYDTDTLQVTVNDDSLKCKYRCVISNDYEEKTSDVVGLTQIEVIPSISLTNVGEDHVADGQSFTLQAVTDNAASIQWQASTDGYNFEDVSGETGDSFTYTNSPAPSEDQTVYYRAVATSSTGNTAVSNVIEVLLLSEDELPIRPQSNSVESKVAENPESETVSETQAAGTGAADSETADKVEDKSDSGVENNGTGLAEDLTSENNTETQTEKETGSEPEAESETQDMTADVSEEAQ